MKLYTATAESFAVALCLLEKIVNKKRKLYYCVGVAIFIQIRLDYLSKFLLWFIVLFMRNEQINPESQFITCVGDASFRCIL